MSENGFPRTDFDAWRAKVERDAPVAELVSQLASGLEVRPLYTEHTSARTPSLGDRTVNTIAYPRAQADLANRIESDRALGIGHWWIRADEGGAIPPNLSADGEFWIDLLSGETATASAGHRHLSDALRAVAQSQAEAATIADEAQRAELEFIAPGNLFREAGAHESLELALLLSGGIEWLRHGVSPAKLIFRTSLGVDVFTEIAKLRALRMLWSGVLCSSKRDDLPARIHGIASRRVLTTRDRWVNMHRNTGAAFAAQLGCADLFTPQAFAADDANADRVARSTATILAEESHLDAVRDPAAGSYAIEELTQDYARAAWKLVREIESQGGFLAALRSGWIADAVEHSAQESARRIRHREDILVGVTAFPKRDDEAAAEPFARREVPFAPQRDAAEFEALRARAEALSERPGVRVHVLGDDPSDKATRGRVGAALAVAGIEIDDRATAVACIAGGSPAEATALAHRLRADGFGFLLYAGGERIEGVDALLSDTCDLHAVLDGVLRQLENVES